MLRRVVITGLGVVTCNGIGKDAFWDACVAGRSGVGPITRFDASPLSSQIAGEIANFDPEALGLTSEEAAAMDRGTQLAVAASNLAMKDAGLLNALNEEERDNAGVYMGTAIASMENGEKLLVQLMARDEQPTNDEMSHIVPAALRMTNAPACAVAAHHQFHGPSTIIATGCSAGADAIGQAFWAIQEGRTDRMLAGGTDSAINYAVMSVFYVLGATSTRNDDPQRASRPYDKDRDGFVMAEGSGVLLLGRTRAGAGTQCAHLCRTHCIQFQYQRAPYDYPAN